MTKSLPAPTYVILNTVLLILATLSIGLYVGGSTEIDKKNIRFDSFMSNRSLIYEYIKVNCSEVPMHYPIFDEFPTIQLCPNHDSSILLGKIATVLSTLFDTLLPFALYGPPIAPVVIMCITSGIIFYINFTSSPLQIMIIESSMIFAGYLLIFVQCVAPNLDDYIGNWWAKGIRQSIRDNNEPIYDDLSIEHDMHDD
ncbi:unnamed protein product [Rotaria magnacalcarata]|uniref:Uncharacterized protein n=1 Tax=Rotaria magnacalcarata TaxID=392030 RepID=A0A815UKI6_9BILA|nr:unnamed protein product [Rotaria magnacalcarata]CAF4121889.1 unnamed protein product [Rotaria magnacalcarata]